MNLAKLIENLRARLPLLVRLSIAVLVLLVLWDAFLVHNEHAQEASAGFWGWLAGLENMPGFWSIFGFIGCVAIILVSKWFGHAGIMKREDYYDE